MQELSFKTRRQNIQRLKNEVFDILIVGGGINGAGVARQSSASGLKVALVEAYDFAQGASSRSSKIVHGGLRYLEYFHFGLVFQSLREKTRLLKIAPHVVKTSPFILPVFKQSRVKNHTLHAGFFLYNLLSLFKGPCYKKKSKEKTLNKVPCLDSKDLLGSYLYHDATMDDAFLVFETLRSAHQYKAVCVNYVEAKKALIQDGKIQKMVCKDNVSKEEFEIQAKHIVFTVGPWTDRLAGFLFPSWREVLLPSKGAHIVFSKKDFPLNIPVVMGAEKRVVFVTPREDFVLVGTTETSYKMDPQKVQVEKEDKAYLLEVLGKYFPNLKLDESKICFSYAGVRPLAKSKQKKAETETSRQHIVKRVMKNATFLLGGKYTTYCKMSEDTVKSVCKVMGRKMKKLKNTPLVQLKSENSELKHLTEKEREYFFSRYGQNASFYLQKFLPQYKSESPERLWLLEAQIALQFTMCFQLKDFYIRRVPFVSFQESFRFLESLSYVFQKRLHWSEEQRIKEVLEVKGICGGEVFLSFKK